MNTGSSKTPVISIIDDDPFVRQATDDLLRSLGYLTAAFASAEDFLQSSDLQRDNLPHQRCADAGPERGRLAAVVDRRR